MMKQFLFSCGDIFHGNDPLWKSEFQGNRVTNKIAGGGLISRCQIADENFVFFICRETLADYI